MKFSALNSYIKKADEALPWYAGLFSRDSYDYKLALLKKFIATLENFPEREVEFNDFLAFAIKEDPKWEKVFTQNYFSGKESHASFFNAWRLRREWSKEWDKYLVKMELLFQKNVVDPGIILKELIQEINEKDKVVLLRVFSESSEENHPKAFSLEKNVLEKIKGMLSLKDQLNNIAEFSSMLEAFFSYFPYYYLKIDKKDVPLFNPLKVEKLILRGEDILGCIKALKKDSLE